jgi:RNA polymerase sigma factor (TIGR02999 family)
MSDPGVTTRLLRRMIDGDASAATELLPLVYRELHVIAERLMAGERREHTLQPTALIHEAWLRLMGGADLSYEDRGHFLRVAARAMRRVLVDHARARKTAKRGEGRAPVPLPEALAGWEQDQTDLLALDEALERLAERDEQLLRVVELRFFAASPTTRRAGSSA